MYPVNGKVAPSFFCAVDEFASKSCTRRHWRMFHRVGDGLIRDDAIDCTFRLNAVEDPSGARYIVILQVEERHSWMAEGQSVPFPIRFDQPMLDYPIAFT